MAKTKKDKGNKILILIAALIIIFIMIIFTPNNCKLLVDKKVEIPKSSSISAIAEILKEEKVISSETSFVIRARLSGKSSKLKYGEFVFSPDMSYNEVITTLCENGAKKETVTISIPEGYSVEMIVKKFTEAGIGTKEEFEKALKKKYDYKFLKNVVVSDECKYKLQGFLFPETYEFYTDATAEDVINKMLSKFEEEYKKTGGSYEDISTIITKASMVEREAKLDSERNMIAGVLENRLDIDMILQIDATVVYAMSDGMYDVERVLFKDLEIDSKYNTYKYKGLPVGPICNPGIESIKAVLKPAEHEYLYYRTTEAGDGSHRFSKTIEEHEGK